MGNAVVPIKQANSKQVPTDKHMKISPKYKVSDWLDISFQTEADWVRATNIFRDRIEGRFLQYIDKIKSDDFAGFLVLAIDCLLIETLMQFKKGVTITPAAREKRYFIEFLAQPQFSFSEEIAKQFYDDFRCGILHQAEVMGSSKVRRGNISLVARTPNGKGLIINRDRFHGRLVDVFYQYISDLQNRANIDLRTKFRCKMDAICRM